MPKLKEGQRTNSVVDTGKDGTLWTILYKDKMIFSAPTNMTVEEFNDLTKYYKTKRGYKLKVISGLKALAIEDAQTKWPGSVINRHLYGCKIEPYYPTCVDMGDYEIRKVQEYGNENIDEEVYYML